MPDFLPSASGFAFVNSWPAGPVLVVRTPLGPVKLGNARGGLCGGMVFAALDFWHAGKVPPSEQPEQGEALYSFIVRRLFDSWHLPAGVLKYYRWMNRPDTGTGGVAWRTISRGLEQTTRALDRGEPVPLGVVATSSAWPAHLGRNHQVLAYAYEVTGTEVTLRVYDPNRGQRDDIAVTFDAAQSPGRTDFRHNLGLSHPVRGFFPIRYAPVAPPDQ